MTEQHRQLEKDLHDHQLYEERRLLEIEQNIKTLEEKIDILTVNVEGLVSAWRAAGWLVSAVKWVSGAAVAAAALVWLPVADLWIWH